MRKSFTLVEVIMAVVIGGIVLYSLLTVFITATSRNTQLETLSTALFLANGKVEEISNQRFNLISSEALASFGGDFSNFSSSVEVYNVSAEALDTAIVASSGYKKIIVRVFSGNLLSTMEVQALVTNVSNN
ncbi:MAG: prepilin-type N-terminal cleavage/methylation domain-containing protein [Candidatus Margulisiibacteriota bacterium]